LLNLGDSLLPNHCYFLKNYDSKKESKKVQCYQYREVDLDIEESQAEESYKCSQKAGYEVEGIKDGEKFASSLQPIIKLKNEMYVSRLAQLKKS